MTAALWPGRFEPWQLDHDVPLGEEGLQLDSIDIVELVLAAGEEVGLPEGHAESLLEGGPITVGGLIDHLSAA